jgi:hypothetical protein
MTLEFIKDEVFFFAAYNRSSQRTEYRREYISMKIRPLAHTYSPDGVNQFTANFNSTRFDKFLWETDSRLKINMTTFSNLTFELVLDFNSFRRVSGAISVKMSFLVYSSLNFHFDVNRFWSQSVFCRSWLRLARSYYWTAFLDSILIQLSNQAFSSHWPVSALRSRQHGSQNLFQQRVFARFSFRSEYWTLRSSVCLGADSDDSRLSFGRNGRRKNIEWV